MHKVRKASQSINDFRVCESQSQSPSPSPSPPRITKLVHHTSDPVKDRSASKIKGQDGQRSTHPTPQSNLLMRTPRSQPPNPTRTFHTLIPTVTYKQFACHMPIPIGRRSPIIGGSERENRERAHSLPILHGLNEPMVRALTNSPQTCMRILSWPVLS